jgi:hypothetical protein
MTDQDKRVWLAVAVFLILSVSFMMGYLVGDSAWIAPIKDSVIQMFNG